MAKKKVQKTKGGNKKIGRTKRKAANVGNPTSNFVRGKISAEQYFKQIKITPKG